MESKLDQLIKKLDTTKTFLSFATHSVVRWPQAELQNKVKYSICDFQSWGAEPGAVPMQWERLSCTGLGVGFDGLSIPLTCDLGFSDFIRTVLLHQDLDQSASLSLEPYSPSLNLEVSVSLRSFPQKPCKQTRRWRLCLLHLRRKTMQFGHLW